MPWVATRPLGDALAWSGARGANGSYRHSSRSDGRIHLTLEVAYGHAWRAANLRHREGETHVAVSAIQRKPSQKSP